MHTRGNTTRALSIFATGLVLALGLTLIPGQVRAQDMEAMAHPAHIHTGTCAALGDVVFPLTDVGADAGTPVAADDMGTPASGEMTESHDMGSPAADSAMGSPEADAFGMDALTSETIVQVALADLLGAEHAINVHESAENIGNYIACGDLTGTPDDSGDLAVELAALNESGYTGTATLHDNGDGTTTVSITLMHDGM
jgi:hypothetical protein